MPPNGKWMRDRMLKWGRENYRDFAWRRTRDPYQVLMAEMMVHRTRAEQAERVWLQFIERWPTAESASRASQADLDALLEPLGLRWRAANIKAAIQQYSTASDARLEDLPGVGHYAAAVVQTVTRGHKRAIVDVNVVRIYGRFFGWQTDDTTRRSASFHRAAATLIPES